MSRQLAGLLIVAYAVLVPVGAQQRGPEINPKKAIAQAQAALDAGRLQEALTLYEAVEGSSSRDAAKYKADALYGIALVRLSPDRSVADAARGRAALEQLTRTNPRYERRPESAALLQLLDELDRHAAAEISAAQALAETKTSAASAASEAAELRKRVDEATANVDALKKQLDSGKDDTDKTRQTLAALRTENRTLRDQLAKTQAELEKKDAALRKIAGSLVK